MPKAQKTHAPGKGTKVGKRASASAVALPHASTATTISASSPKLSKGAKAAAAASTSKGKQKEERPAPAPATARPLQIAGYTVLPLRYHFDSDIASSSRAPLPAVFKHGTVHYLYLRPDKNTPSSSATDATHLETNRSLFVANLPVDATERHLRQLFKNAGAIEKVVFQQGSSVPLSGQHILDALDSRDPADDDDDMDNDDDSDDGVGADPVKLEAAAAAELLQQRLDDGEGKRRKKKGKKKTADEPAPRVQALPALDAREAAGARALLPTCTSAHIVFLDASSLTRALAQAEQTSAAFMAAGGPALLRDFGASASATSLAALLKAARPWMNPYAAPSPGAPPSATPTQVPALGLPYLLATYQSQRPSLERVKAFADSRINLHVYLRAHPDRDPRERAKQAQRRIQAVRIGPEGELLDEDGFTIVTSGGKYGRSAEAGTREGPAGEGGSSVRVARNLPHMASGAAYEAAMGPPKKKSKSKDLEDFYRFQTREKNREKLAQLRAKFQEDKLKVEKLKESRKFKPY